MKRKLINLKQKVCVVTGSRADYGLLRWTIQSLSLDKEIDLQICVTGMHLIREFGLTYREILADGFAIKKRVHTLANGDAPIDISKSIARGVSGFAKVFEQLRPDMLLVVGDRFETFAAVVAAVAFKIPIAHCHGGETTEGAIDEAFRHSITKMAHLHFVATPEYRNRVLQMGEDRRRVFISGALGLENINKIKLLNVQQLQEQLKVTFLDKLVVVTYHPVTLEANTAARQFNEILEALKKLKNTTIIFTLPNADTGGRVIISMIHKFVAQFPAIAKCYPSLGTQRYLSLLKTADIVIGNSSSGIIEAPSLKTATINIGDRQKGRVRASSVIDVEPQRKAIFAAIRRCYTKSHRDKVSRTKNPYDHGNASDIIVKELKCAELASLIKKTFSDFRRN